MSDEKKPIDDTPTKPDRKIEETLDGILGWVHKKKIQAADPKTVTTKSSPWGWVVGLVVAVLIFFALAFVAWRAWSKGREVAKLKHELDKKKEYAESARIDSYLRKNKEKKEELERDANALEAEVVILKSKIKVADEERKIAHETIDKITNWEDVDRLLGAEDEKHSD